MSLRIPESLRGLIQHTRKRKKTSETEDEQEMENLLEPQFETSYLIYMKLKTIAIKLNGTVSNDSKNLLIRDEFIRIGPEESSLTELFFNHDQPIFFQEFSKSLSYNDLLLITPFVIIIYFNINANLNTESDSRLFPSSAPSESLVKDPISTLSTSKFMQSKRKVITAVTPFKIHSNSNPQTETSMSELTEERIDQAFNMIFVAMSKCIQQILDSDLDTTIKSDYAMSVIKGTMINILDLHTWKNICVERVKNSAKNSENVLQMNMDHLLQLMRNVGVYHHKITIEFATQHNIEIEMSDSVTNFITFNKLLTISSKFRYADQQRLPLTVSVNGDQYIKPSANIDCDISIGSNKYKKSLAFSGIELKLNLCGTSYSTFHARRYDASSASENNHNFGSEYTRSITFSKEKEPGGSVSNPLELSKSSKAIQSLHKQIFSYMSLYRFVTVFLLDGTTFSLFKLNKVQFEKMIDSKNGHLNIVTFEDIQEQLENIFETWVDENARRSAVDTTISDGLHSVKQLRELYIFRLLGNYEEDSGPFFDSFINLKKEAATRLRLVYKSDNSIPHDEPSSLDDLKSYLVDFILHYYCFKSYMDDYETNSTHSTSDKYRITRKIGRLKNLWAHIEDNYERVRDHYNKEMVILPFNEIRFKNCITTNTDSLIIPLQSAILFFLFLVHDSQNEYDNMADGTTSLEDVSTAEDLDLLLHRDRTLLMEKINGEEMNLSSNNPSSAGSGPVSSGIGPSGTGPSGTGPSGTGPSGTGPSGTGPSGTGPSGGGSSNASTFLSKQVPATQMTKTRYSVTTHIPIPTPPDSASQFPVVKSYDEHSPLIGEETTVENGQYLKTIAIGRCGQTIQDTTHMFQVYKVDRSDIVSLFPPLAKEDNFSSVPEELIWKLYDYNTITQYYEKHPVFYDVMPVSYLIEEKYQCFFYERLAYKMIEEHNKKVTETSDNFINIPKIYYCGKYRVKKTNYDGCFLLMTYLKRDLELNREYFHSLAKTRQQKILNDCIKIIRNLNRLGIRHLDIRWRNFIMSGGKIYIIDFSQADINSNINNQSFISYEVDEGDTGAMRGMLMRDD